MARIWRVQETPDMERKPCWEGWRSVDPDVPADPEWPGYWWATGNDPWTKNTSYLIRASDVERARFGENVDTYYPGIHGCADPRALLSYIERNIEKKWLDSAFVALYNGRIVERTEDGIIFEPLELLEVWPAAQWCLMQRHAHGQE
jgi:hypothetical protein